MDYDHGGRHQDAERNAKQLRSLSKRARTEQPLFPESSLDLGELLGHVTDDDDKINRIRVTTTLHWPWEPGLPIPYDTRRKHAPDTLQRPAIFRSLLCSTPIDRTAKRVAGNEFGQFPCPYCPKYFRNPAACALHIEESHGREARVLFADTEEELEEIEANELQRLDKIREAEAREQQSVEEWLRWL